jgi:hypothetical protein
MRLKCSDEVVDFRVEPSVIEITGKEKHDVDIILVGKYAFSY